MEYFPGDGCVVYGWSVIRFEFVVVFPGSESTRGEVMTIVDPGQFELLLLRQS